MSGSALTPIKKNNIYEQVVEHLKRHIVANELGPGDRLPTEAVLAENLNVSRLSVREALKVMESLGIVQSKTRDGTRLQAPTMKPVAEHLRFLVDVRQVSLREIAVARQMTESALMPLVVANAEEADYEKIQATIVAMEAAVAIDNIDDVIEADGDFHQALLAAAKNRAVEGFAVMLQEFFGHPRLRAVALEKGGYRVSVESHQEIYRALRAGDAALASRLMHEHFAVYTELEE